MSHRLVVIRIKNLNLCLFQENLHVYPKTDVLRPALRIGDHSERCGLAVVLNRSCTHLRGLLSRSKILQTQREAFAKIRRKVR